MKWSIVLLSLVSATFAQNGFPLGKSSFSNNPVIRYAAENSIKLNQAQRGIIQETNRRYGGGMMGAPEVVQLNQLLIKAIGGKKVLDVGLFTGYSALGAALMIPNDGEVIGMDIVPQYWTTVGSRFARSAGVENKIKTYFQPAKRTMEELIANGTSGQWDFCFIDADKFNYGVYYEQCLTLLRSGGIIVVDNALWGGSVSRDPRFFDGSTRAIDQLNKRINNDTRVISSLLTIADGINIVLKK